MVDMSTIYKRTKILATIGPASDSEEMIEKLIRGGINGARLNFSHGSYDEHATKIKAVREISKKVGKEVAILQDLQGPKIRLGDLVNNNFPVQEGDEIVLDFAVKASPIGCTLYDYGYDQISNTGSYTALPPRAGFGEGKITPVSVTYMVVSSLIIISMLIPK